MEHWKKLNLFWKFVFGVALILAAFIAPEVMFVLDFAGIEIAFAFLVLYFKPLLQWFKVAYQELNSSFKLAYSALLTSAFLKPKVFSLQTSFCLVCFVVTGSFLFSTFFLLPAFLGNGLIV